MTSIVNCIVLMLAASTSSAAKAPAPSTESAGTIAASVQEIAPTTPSSSAQTQGPPPPPNASGTQTPPAAKPSPPPSDKPQSTTDAKPAPPDEKSSSDTPQPSTSDKPLPPTPEKSSSPTADKTSPAVSDKSSTASKANDAQQEAGKPVDATAPPASSTDSAPSPSVAPKREQPSTQAATATSAPAVPASTTATAQPEPRSRLAPWRAFDGISIVVNEDMFTRQVEQRDLNNYRVDPKDQANVLMQIRRDRVTRFLEVQAGQDMGLDPALVKRQVTDNVEVLVRERFKGVADLADYMQSKDMDSIELREQLKNQIYAEIWEKYITGEAPVPGSRVSRDRFVRPGMMRLYYENGMQHPENVELIGGKQQEVVLQQLFIDEMQYGGAEQARNMLTTLRRRILDGEDMGDICERYSAVRAAKKDHGRMPARPEARFASLDPAIGTFLAGAKPGDVSDPLPYQSEDKARFWRIVKLVERTPAVLPDLQSRDVQQKLLKRIQDDYDGIRKGIALDQLFRASYVWPPELSQRTEQPAR